MRALPLLRIGFVAGLAACQPDLGPTGSIITGQTILAIKAEPAEGTPGQTVMSYRALVASPPGDVTAAQVEWAYCTASKPLSEDNAVSPDCLGDSAVVSIGTGASPAALLPMDACARFGPDVPSQPAGQPPLRPRDPDVTGGYYQPLRALLGSETAIGLERISCNLAGASSAVAAEYRARYTPNRNPSIVGIGAFVQDRPVDLANVPSRTRLRLSATWSTDASETYPVFDPATDSLVARRETLRVSWFATAGQFDTDHTGATGDEPATATENGWMSPDGGPVHIWVVLRDDRGGVDFVTFDLSVFATP